MNHEDIHLHEQEKPRAVRLCKIRIDVIPKTQVIGGRTPGRTLAFLAHEGINEAYVYEDDVDWIRTLVEDEPEKILEAEKWLRESRNQYIQEAKARAAGQDLDTRNEDFWRDYDGPTTVAEAMHRRYFRGPKPLRSLEVIESNIPPPTTDEERRVSSIVDAQTRASSEAIQTMANAMMDMIKELRGARAESTAPAPTTAAPTASPSAGASKPSR